MAGRWRSHKNSAHEPAFFFVYRFARLDKGSVAKCEAIFIWRELTCQPSKLPLLVMRTSEKLRSNKYKSDQKREYERRCSEPHSVTDRGEGWDKTHNLVFKRAVVKGVRRHTCDMLLEVKRAAVFSQQIRHVCVGSRDKASPPPSGQRQSGRFHQTSQRLPTFF